MTKKQMEMCGKVKAALEDMHENGNLKRYHVPSAGVLHCIAGTYNAIVRRNYAETITTEVKDFFQRRGFKVEEKGIGWIISL